MSKRAAEPISRRWLSCLGGTAIVVTDIVPSGEDLMRGLVRLPAMALAAGLQCICPAPAQDWPSRPVRVIVPVTAGGSTDGMSYAASGVGVHQHIVAEWFQQIAGIK